MLETPSPQPEVRRPQRSDSSGGRNRRTARFLVQNPYLQALGFSLVAVGAIFVGLSAFKRVADAVSPQPPSLPPDVDLWLELRLVTADGETVTDGARLPQDTIIRLERFAGTETSIGGPRLSLTGSGDFQDRSPVVTVDDSPLRELRTPVAWSAVDIREGTPLRLRDAGEYSALVLVLHRPAGFQRPLRFVVGSCTAKRGPSTEDGPVHPSDDARSSP